MTSQADIDRILGTWLAGGAERAPADRVRAAISTVATTRQRRVIRIPAWSGGRPLAHPALLLSALAVALVGLVGLGIGIRVGVIRLPLPSPPIEPGPTMIESIDGLHVDRAISGYGYRAAVPASWVMVGDMDPAMLRFNVTDGSGTWPAIQIAAEREDGSVTLCASRCATFSGIDTLDQLRAALHDPALEAEPIDGPFGPYSPPRDPVVLKETLLGGEPARTEAPDLRGFGWGSEDDFEHIYAVHDGRAVVLSFGYRAIRLGKVPRDVIQHIRYSFRFVDPEELGLELYSNPEGGYEVLLPANWVAEPRMLDREAGGSAVAFGSGRGAGTHGSPALTITVGESDGSIGTCFNCDDTVTTLDELEQLLVSTPPFFTTGPAERHTELVLGGEFGRSESAGIGNNCLGCPQAYYHVFTIHDGRPVVMAFDYWTVRFGSMVTTPGNEVPFTPEMLAAILESFRFLDGGVGQP